jgi:Zn-dependent peptidase ImmA (M78 family)/transcriptional regulator with XRE-family HTH domain
MSRSSTKGIFVKERLIEGREARGYTQRDIGASLKRAESTISNWERGTQAPEPSMLESIANSLGVYPPYFLKPLPDHGECPIFFRSLANAAVRTRTREKARVRWLQHISLAIQDVLDLPPLDIPEFVKGSDYLRLKTEDLERIAAEMRAHWDLGEGPIRSMVLVAENAGVVVGVDEVGSTSIDGQGTWSLADGRPYILLCTDKFTAYRRQMDVSHELAHIVLHRGVKNEAELATNFEIIERQAKYLATAFLLPHRAFSAEISSLSLEGFLSLKRRWMTSVGAMIMRSEQLEMLSHESASLLWRYRAARGWTRREPYDLPEETPVEEPCLLRRCIEMIVNQGGRSKHDFLETDVSLGAPDVEMLACLPSGFFNKDPSQVLRLEPKFREKSTVSTGAATSEVIPFKRPAS